MVETLHHLDLVFVRQQVVCAATIFPCLHATSPPELFSWILQTIHEWSNDRCGRSVQNRVRGHLSKRGCEDRSNEKLNGEGAADTKV